MSEVTGFQSGVNGVNDNDILVTLDETGSSDTFNLMSTAGAMDVQVSLDGVNYTTAPLALTDQGATVSDPVLVTAPNRMYGFRGKYRRVRVLQNGVTAVVNPSISYGQM